jgi:AcrR family transcriptional regulator
MSTAALDDARQRHPTKQAILRVAIEELDEFGQGGFRIAHVVKASNASFSSLYHHFGSREALIREAQANRYVPMEQIALGEFRAAAGRAETPPEFSATFAQLISRLLNDPAAQRGRRKNAEVLGFAMTDDELLTRIVYQQRLQTSGFTATLRDAQRRGLIREDLNIETYVIWMLGMLFGHILLEIDPVLGPSSAEWDKCALLALLQPLSIGAEPTSWAPSWESLEYSTKSVTALPRSLPAAIFAAEELVAPPLHPTAQALLDRTKQLLEAVGEESLRLPQILDGLGTSVTSLYHFFGNREGLIVSAHADRFVDRTNEAIEAFATAASHTTTFDEFLAFMTLVINMSAYGPHFIQFRRTRTQVLGAAMSRPQLLDALAVSQRRTLMRFGSVTKGAVDRGQIRSDMDAEATTLWYQGIQLGRVLSEIDPELAENESWTNLTIEGTAAAFR